MRIILTLLYLVLIQSTFANLRTMEDPVSGVHYFIKEQGARIQKNELIEYLNKNPEDLSQLQQVLGHEPLSIINALQSQYPSMEELISISGALGCIIIS